MMATGDKATRVKVVRNTSTRSQSSTVANTGNNDRARKNSQDVQSNSVQLDNRNGLEAPSPRINVVSSVEVPRGGENQQPAPGVETRTGCCQKRHGEQIYGAILFTNSTSAGKTDDPTTISIESAAIECNLRSRR